MDRRCSWCSLSIRITCSWTSPSPWARVLGQILSYTSSLPVLAVTAAATLANVYRSGMKWNVTTSLLFVSIMGWSVGRACCDRRDDRDQPRDAQHALGAGHFIYLLLGVVAMLFGFMYFLGMPRARRTAPRSRLRVAVHRWRSSGSPFHSWRPAR